MNPERLEIEADKRRWGHQLPVSDKLATILHQMVRFYTKDI
ncbi:hypothetical protein [Microcoleus sp. FACHB-68]|nr:hypothetical protein [Microcoleus sp. FACHB-68]